MTRRQPRSRRRPGGLATAALALALAAGCAETVTPGRSVDAGDAAVADAGPPDAGPASVVEAHALGLVSIRVGESDALTLDLPGDVVALQVVMVDATDAALLVVTTLEGPDGQRLVDPEAAVDPDLLLGPFPAAAASPNPAVALASGVGGLLAPNSPAVALTPGPWRLRLGAVDALSEAPFDGDVDVTAFVRRGAPLARARLPIHVYCTGAAGLTAATAPDDAALQASLQRAADLLAQAEISLEIMGFSDAVGPASLPAEGGVDSALHALFRQHDAPGTVGVFLVGRLVAPFGTDVAGVAGGLPGPPILAGTTRSGVALSVDIGLSPAATGQVLAHELGHALGLFHTVEPGGLPDPLPDTPDDPDDTTNLMAPRVAEGPQVLTPQQGAVLRAGAALDSP